MGRAGEVAGDGGLSASEQHNPESEPLEHAVGLLSQQAWCWGRDILRPEGNWLLELGFERTKPPAKHQECFASQWRALANTFAAAPSLLFSKHEEESFT